MLEAELDASQRPCDFARDERFATAGRLVIEQNAVSDKEPVGLAIVDGIPMGGNFGDSIGAAGVKRGALVLRRLGAPNISDQPA